MIVSATSSAVSGMHAELAQMRSQWAARVAAAATGPGGLIPEAAVPGLLAEREWKSHPHQLRRQRA